LLAHLAHLHEALDRTRRVQLRDDVPGGGRIHHDEVPIGAPGDRFPHLPADLADRQDLLDARRGGRNELEHIRQRTEATKHWDTQVQAEVLAQRRFGPHLHHEDAGMYLARFEANGRVFEQRGQVALGLDLHEQDALAAFGGEQRRRRGDGALADAAFAGEEQQPAVEEIRRWCDRHYARPKPTRRVSPSASISTSATFDAGTPRRRPLESENQTTRSSAASAASIILPTSSAEPSTSI